MTRGQICSREHLIHPPWNWSKCSWFLLNTLFCFWCREGQHRSYCLHPRFTAVFGAGIYGAGTRNRCSRDADVSAWVLFSNWGWSYLSTLSSFYESYPHWSGESQNYPGFNFIISDEAPCKKMPVNKAILHHISMPQPAVMEQRISGIVMRCKPPGLCIRVINCLLALCQVLVWN